MEVGRTVRALMNVVMFTSFRREVGKDEKKEGWKSKHYRNLKSLKSNYNVKVVIKTLNEFWSLKFRNY